MKENKTVFSPERVRQLREQHGLSWYKFGKQLDKTHKTIQNWENGISEPKPENIGKMCDIYGTTADYFFVKKYVRKQSCE